MQMTSVQALITILAIAAGTQFTRWLPFWLFPEKRQVPRDVLFLGQALPPAMMGLLLVYCLPGVDFSSAPYAVPEAVALLAIYFLHRWKHNALLSIAGGTAVYLMLLRALGG